MPRVSIVTMTTISKDGEIINEQNFNCPACLVDKPKPGAHHSVVCDFYRSPYIGPEASLWKDRLDKYLRARARSERKKRST